MTVRSCPRDSNGYYACEYQTSATCFSLLPGHLNTCKVANGYLTCLDITRISGGTNSCKQGSYGINKDSIWVKDGCHADFHACYTKELPGSTVMMKTMQCESERNQYRECEVRGPYLIKSVKRKYDDPNPNCREEDTYGSYLNSMWVRDGCSDIFDIEYLQESPTQSPSLLPPVSKAKTSTTSSTTTPSPIVRNRTTTPSVVTSTSRTTLPVFVHKTTPILVTSTTLAPQSTLNDGLVLITLGALLGVFLSLLIMTFVICWLCQRSVFMRRFLNMKKVPTSAEHEHENVSNFYEEITCQDVPVNYTAQSENDPFLEGTLRRKQGQEENNNPSGVQNYFVLEDQPFVPRYPTNTRTPPGHGYFILEPQTEPSAPPLQDSPNHISSFQRGHYSCDGRERQPSPDIIKSLSAPYHVQNIIPERDTSVDSDGYDIVGTFKQKYFLPQSKKVNNVSLNTIGSQTDKSIQIADTEEQSQTSC